MTGRKSAGGDPHRLAGFDLRGNSRRTSIEKMNQVSYSESVHLPFLCNLMTAQAVPEAQSPARGKAPHIQAGISESGEPTGLEP